MANRGPVRARAVRPANRDENAIVTKHTRQASSVAAAGQRSSATFLPQSKLGVTQNPAKAAVKGFAAAAVNKATANAGKGAQTAGTGAARIALNEVTSKAINRNSKNLTEDQNAMPGKDVAFVKADNLKRGRAGSTAQQVQPARRVPFGAVNQGQVQAAPAPRQSLLPRQSNADPRPSAGAVRRVSAQGRAQRDVLTRDQVHADNLASDDMDVEVEHQNVAAEIDDLLDEEIAQLEAHAETSGLVGEREVELLVNGQDGDGDVELYSDRDHDFAQEDDQEEVTARQRLTSASAQHRHSQQMHELEEVLDADLEAVQAELEHVWPDMPSARKRQCNAEVDRVRSMYQDEYDTMDPSMVSEYATEIFEYMEKLEGETMPNPSYMDDQGEVTWNMRQTLVDWLSTVHFRYHMLPETLWIAINIMDRFLSKRVVSLVKLQLVGITAMFIAAKYEEILAPAVDEFVYMTENGYTREEVLKGERIVLQTLEFHVSQYCSPYSWMRRISKADDYDLQTRTLSKFLTEVTLLDHRFLGCKPSLIAAVGMYAARRMLGGDWEESFVFHSGYVEEQLLPGFRLMIEKLCEPGFESMYICKKYAHRKFLKSSIWALEWARDNLHDIGPAGKMAVE